MPTGGRFFCNFAAVMVLNYIWIAFFVAAFLTGAVELVMGDTTVFQHIVDSTFDSSKNAFEVSLGLTGVLSLWLGIMKIGEKAGVVNVLARGLSPVFSRLFPDIPKGHPVFGSIFMNIASNMLGLDNAATPTGLRAMAQMQELNAKKDTATNPMIMFLVLNTSGLTIIPTTILAFRAANGAQTPTDVFIPILLATSVATIAGIIITSLWQRINLLQPVLLMTIGGLVAFVGLTIWGFGQMDSKTMGTVTSVASNLILFGIITLFVVAGWMKRINVYEAFIEGAKDGFATAVRIIPYLVAILVAVGVFRACGAMDMLIGGISWCVEKCGPHEATERQRGTRADAGGYAELRSRLLRGATLVHLPGQHRHHILYLGRLLRQRQHQVHPPRRGLRPARRSGRCDRGDCGRVCILWIGAASLHTPAHPNKPQQTPTNPNKKTTT